MKMSAVLLAVVVALTASAFSQAKVGERIDDFNLSDLDGKMQSLASIKGPKGAVLIFVSSQCPVVRGYNERMNELYKTYKIKGINIVGIDSNVTELASEVKAHAAANWSFPVLIDKGAKLADKLGAYVTPEAFYLDANNKLLYYGAIDNGRSGRAITETFLQTALDLTLAGKSVERTNARSFGCSIKRAEQ